MTHDVRFPRPVVEDILGRMTETVRPHVSRTAWAGSYRRGSDDCGDADLLVLPKPGHHRDLRDAVLGLASDVVFDGSSMLYIVIPADGMSVPAQVFIAEPDSWGSSLQYTTGSREHNLAIRKWAKDRGMTANQYGVFRRGMGRGSKFAGSSETESGFYAALGLRWVRPEMRIRRVGGSTGIFPLTHDVHPHASHRRQPGTCLEQGDGGSRKLAPAGASQPAYGSDDVPDRRPSR